jgi:hypothetical protein
MCLPNVTSDGEDFRRWLEGATEPTWTRKQLWLDTLRKERENGQISTRVRILSNQVTDYERYACGFGYRYNGEYEDIRVLHRGEHEIPADLIERDFWIIGRSIVVTMYYDQHGRLDGAEVANPGELADHLRTRDAAWAAAEPLPHGGPGTPSCTERWQPEEGAERGRRHRPDRGHATAVAARVA